MKPQDCDSNDFERAKCDPAAVFGMPEEVVDHPTFTLAQKVEILQAWVQDATRLSESESEGMGGGEPAMLGRVLEVLHRVEAMIGDHQASPGMRTGQ